MLRVRFLLFLLLLPLSARADPAVDQSQNTAVVPTGNVVQVKLGESSVELDGPWKFHIGDDPAWSQPDFDDSGWEEIDLTPDSSTGVALGWTAHGHRGYSGYAWYRLQVEVEGAKRSLALKMPDSFDDAYQVFVNGQHIGEFGKFKERSVTAYPGLPTDFRLPKGVRDGKITIAVRVWMDSATPFNSPDAGGLRQPPELGYASAISDQVRLDWDDVGHGVGSGFLEMLVLVMALLMALALFWFDREEKSYLWLALVCEASLLLIVPVLIINFTTWMGLTEFIVIHDIIAFPLRIGLWILFWGYWFRLRRMRAVHYAVWSLVILLAIGTAMLRPPLYGRFVPVSAASFLHPFVLMVNLGLGVLLLLVAYRGFYKNKGEGGLAAAAVLLAVIANYQHELHLIHVQIFFNWLGFQISLGSISTILSLLLITVMLLGRFITAQRAKEQWKMEIAQARHIQQVLIPSKLPELNDLHIDSEYRPVREVGGDFFQIIPHHADGSLLIVAGDVTGKGLKAGMLVALLVGAIRAEEQHGTDPAVLLSTLNQRLMGRADAQATCLALRIEADGGATLANAGHVAPYLNGEELPMEGALPLGMFEGAECSVMRFEFKVGDRLVLMSDGIAEATDADGKLFGFERVHKLLRTGTSAAEVAGAAQAFGQEDDISVISITRTAALESAAA